MELHVDGHNINAIPEIQYIMIQMDQNMWGTKFKFLIDVGQGIKTEKNISDPEGNTIEFKGQIDLMNYVFRAGWKFIHSEMGHHPSKGTQINKMYFERK